MSKFLEDVNECDFDCRTANTNKIKVNSLEIIVRKIVDKHYYELKYREIDKKDYFIGYSSYDLKIVLDYIDTYFEIVRSDKQTNADRIRNMTDEELAEWIHTKTMCNQCICESDSCLCMKKPCTNGILQWLQSEAE